MTPRRLSILQWGGLLAAAVTFLAGVELTQADCNPGLHRWRIPHDGVQIGLTAFGVVLTLAAEAAAWSVFRATRGVDDEDAPPAGRRHFVAAAALAANVVFLMIVVLTGTGSLAVHLCRQS